MLAFGDFHSAVHSIEDGLYSIFETKTIKVAEIYQNIAKADGKCWVLSYTTSGSLCLSVPCLSKCCLCSLRALKTKLAKEYPQVVAGEHTHTPGTVRIRASGALKQEMVKLLNYWDSGTLGQEITKLLYCWNCHLNNLAAWSTLDINNVTLVSCAIDDIMMCHCQEVTFCAHASFLCRI